jgi:CubicO group peptidase (beta-lactamase class C family)
MKRLLLVVVLGFFIRSVQAQALYFPPASGTVWDTIPPSALGWCQPNIDSLYSFLQSKNTDAFIVLKSGKIVLEKYFGTFTVDSFHIWNSASKSLTAMLTGIAQENGVVNIDSPATKYLGAGWTVETPMQEDSITMLNLLTMTSGTSPIPTGGCSNTDTNAACLQYLAPPGTEWAYHTGAYRKIETALSNAAGLGYGVLTANYIGNTIGMPGFWVQQEFVSTPRAAARFGILALNKGIWAGDTLLHDTAYFRAMTNTSQAFNLSYGYLWWLNGKASYMTPSSQMVYSGYLIPNAPPDMICALGKNDQKIYVVPGDSMVVVRFGDAADSSADAITVFDNQLWGYMDSLGCVATGINDLQSDAYLNIYPNPASDMIHIPSFRTVAFKKIEVYNLPGALVAQYAYQPQIDISALPADIYIVRAVDAHGNAVAVAKVVKE